MKLHKIKELISIFPSLQLRKVGGNDFLLIDSTSSSDIYRGVRITNSRFSTSISVWLTSPICFPSSDTIVFSNHQMFIEGGQQELSLNKDLFDENQIFQKFKEAIENNLQPLKIINDLLSLEDYLSYNADQWLISAFSKAQYALLCFYNQRNSRTGNWLKSVYTSLNPYNPLTKEVEQFIALTEQSDSEQINNYFQTIRSLSDTRINKLLSNGE